MRSRLLAATVLMLATPVGAQVDDVEATVVEELVVQARLPGPAWWRVSDADTVVYVLGLPEATPKGLVWDRSVLERRLAGANVLITPPSVEITAGFGDIFGLYGAYRTASNAGSKLDEGVAPDMKARLHAAVAAVGMKLDDVQSWRPWFAGVRLIARFQRRSGLVDDEVEDAVRKAARTAKAPTQPALVQREKGVPLFRKVNLLPPDVGYTCLTEAVEAIEAGDAVTRRAAQAWATGDVKTALTAPRTAERCIAAVPGEGDLKRNSLAAQADAITTALAKPGHAVAALSLRSLVAEDGVLQRLRAAGHDVRTPE